VLWCAYLVLDCASIARAAPTTVSETIATRSKIADIVITSSKKELVAQARGYSGARKRP
jgi:hypothetical protein